MQPELTYRLYRVAKRLPCTCWNHSHWTPGGRVVDQKCDRCVAVEEYEELEKATKEGRRGDREN